MPRMILSIDGVVVKEVQLTKDRTTLGRRPYNDVVIDNLAVSGEHAVVQITGNEVYLEDLNSTNGTYVNGKAIKRQLLQDSDMVEIGKYRIRFALDNAAGDSDKTMVLKPGAAVPGMGSGAGEVPTLRAAIKVLSGTAAGREVPLTKVVTTLGKPGVAVASITRRPHAFVLAHVDGATRPTLNGNPVGTEAMPLSNGDVLELAGTQMQFVQL